MIEKYSHDKHYDKLVDWLARRGMAKPDPEFLSDVGFCIEGNAIGFLYKTNSKAAYFDNVAANPTIEKEDRDRALNILFRIIEERAKEAGYKVIFATTSLPSVMERLSDHGYNGHQLVKLFFKILGRN